MQTIEIFRPGTHTASSGALLSFDADDIAATASAYDPLLHEAPIVVGHPEHDKPAYGWVKGLQIKDGALVADLDQVDADFGELVKAGRFKKISAAFYRPDAPANPKPGSWYLRHVGFLGAQPPAVKGLKPVQFATSEEGVVEFACGAGSGASEGYGAGLPGRIDSSDVAGLAAAAQQYQGAQAELGRQLSVAAAVEAVRMRDPAHLGRLAARFQEAYAENGIAITVADAVRAIMRDPSAAEHRAAQQRAASAAREAEAIDAVASLATGYVEACAANGVHVNAAEAVRIVRAAADGPRFAERDDMADAVGRAARAHQAKLEQLGVRITIAEAVREVREQMGVGVSQDPLDPQNLLRKAAWVGLTAQQLVRKARQEQASWERAGIRRTLFEACWFVINGRQEDRKRRDRRPMTPAELAALNAAS